METPPPHINNFGGRLVDTPSDFSLVDPIGNELFARGPPLLKAVSV